MLFIVSLRTVRPKSHNPPMPGEQEVVVKAEDIRDALNRVTSGLAPIREDNIAGIRAAGPSLETAFRRLQASGNFL